jgi:probable phosphoglycerate mutase
VSDPRPIAWLARHGETEWSRTLRHTGRTDIPLTPEGEDEARALREPFAAIELDRVFCSPLGRARETCELAGLGDRAEIRESLLEWDYGEYEGITSAEIHETRPGWLLWRDGCPGGESPAAVGARADEMVEELLGIDGTVAVFAHGHLLRVLTARWLSLAPGEGKHFGLGTATLSRLGWEHDYRVIQRWNAPVR